MPTPPRTSLGAIVRAGLEVVESSGVAALTMQAVAKAVGVRPPSLYKHVAHREELVSLVADAAALDLAAYLSAAPSASLSASSQLADLARALRRWAVARPGAYGLVFSGFGSAGVSAAASEPVVTLCGAVVGQEHALAAARFVTAWSTGFISMELAGAFALGGSVDEAFEYGLERLVVALEGA